MPYAAPTICSKCKQSSNDCQCPKHNWSNRKGSGRGGRPWRRLRERILKRDSYLCQPCKQSGRLTPANEVDHITNKAQGGKDNPENLQAICKECHKAKTQSESKAFK